MSFHLNSHGCFENYSSAQFKLCRAMEELGLAYCFQPSVILPDDPLVSTSNHRKVDFIVFNNGCHLFVEITAPRHDDLDDLLFNYIKDYYLFQSCGSLTLRFTDKYVESRPLTAAGLIWSCFTSQDNIFQMGCDWPKILKSLRDEERNRRELEWKAIDPINQVIGDSTNNSNFIE